MYSTWLTVVCACASACVAQSYTLLAYDGVAKVPMETVKLGDGSSFRVSNSRLKITTEIKCGILFSDRTELDEFKKSANFDVQMTWMKNDKKINCDAKEEETFSCQTEEIREVEGSYARNYTLKIDGVNVKTDPGIYTCSFRSIDGAELNNEVQVLLPPVIRVDRTDHNAVDTDDYRPKTGESVNLVCIVEYAYPAVHKSDHFWSWRETGSDEENKKFQNFDNVIENVDTNPIGVVVKAPSVGLTVRNVVKTNRLVYICTASNTAGTTKEPVYLRVKDAMAWLWPGIGILLELVLVLLIIGANEVWKMKRRKESTEE